MTNKTPIRIALAGDSTVADYPGDDPMRGWGQILPRYFNTDDVIIGNFAAGGRSTKTFITEGRWASVLAFKPDWVLIQFGHNDSHEPHLPESTDADTEYAALLRRYVDDTHEAAATPILVTPMHRARWNETGVHLTQELAPYADAMRRVAAEKGVALIDLYALSEAAFEEMGEPALSGLLAEPLNDRTHFNAAGAELFAGMVASQFMRIA
ncbi:MAG TPA: rhamnogalacturonan acetylesterase [Capsulimonadaceae bacterium]|jgi:lysophospholipase L1-like esterase